MLTLLGMSQAVAQEYEYVPFVREGVKWEYTCWNSRYGEIFTLELKGDVEIDGKTYKAMHKYSGDKINWENDTVPVYLREEDKVVYGIVPDGKTYDDCPVGVDRDQAMMEKIAAGEEFVLYDFNDAAGLVEAWSTIPDNRPCKVLSDVVSIAGKKARRYMSVYNSNDFCVIEGIGLDGIFYGYPIAMHNCLVTLTSEVSLNRVLENGVEIYRSEHYKVPRYGSLEEILPIAREGVQWVNERVVISKGDTTRYYYNYEFKGATNSQSHPICYSYTGNTLDSSTAKVAAVFQIDGNMNNVVRDYYIYNNEAYETVLEEDRNMISYVDWYGRHLLYKFSRTQSDIEFFSAQNYPILYQREDFLTRENFKEVEPLEIEGMKCRRYAYLGEDGEPLAYIVEGIGFDSRDMGDLLTPFTRQPDPDADYQEYCGLSHVIKDGEIIYKGLRYDPDAVTILPGDVNGDGEITIADANGVIDIVVMGGNPSHPRVPSESGKDPADLNGDGEVNIADVNAIIDLIVNDK